MVALKYYLNFSAKNIFSIFTKFFPILKNFEYFSKKKSLKNATSVIRYPHQFSTNGFVVSPTLEFFSPFPEFLPKGMGKEVENLITENNELLATKNALNIVKDDLIAKVDELTGEHEILREEIKSLQAVRSKLQQKVQDLEDELKKVKEDAEQAKAQR